MNIRHIHIIMIILLISTSLQAQMEMAKIENEYYTLKSISIPDDITLEVGGLAFDEDGVLYAATRRGEVWSITNPTASRPEFKRFAHGLHEVLGLAYRQGALYMTQRGELNKIQDTDDDGIADVYRTLYRWPLTGNYHEYSYGPKFLPNGDMIISLNLSWIGHGASLTKWRGWMLKITEAGEMTPIATGMRSPAGFGFNAEGDLFYTENQGDWVGSGRMTHVEPGDFVGHPEGLTWATEPGSPVEITAEDIDESLGLSLYEYGEKLPAVKAPSIWFPHTIMGISTSDILLIENNNQVGPFAGQFLVGDQGHSKIMRVFQEKIDGVYQGAVFGFREGFASGVLRLIWGPENEIFVGMTNRGWRSTGEEPFGIQRLKWTGKTPFEMKAIRIQPTGFEIEFTKPVHKILAQDLAHYQLTDFTYKYHHNYGSPVIDQQMRGITEAIVSQDGYKVQLMLDTLRLGYVYEVKVNGVNASDGSQLLHQTGYYTLNRIPEGDRNSMMSARTSGNSSAESVTSSKRIAEMPKNWDQGPDQIITLGTVPGLKYDQEEITVLAGNKVKLVFNNNDDMLHNVLIVREGGADKVGQMAANMGLGGEARSYVPESDMVLHHTLLLEPNESDEIYFVAPREPGVYEYVCTFPGHYLTMRGKLIVQ